MRINPQPAVIPTRRHRYPSVHVAFTKNVKLACTSIQINIPRFYFWNISLIFSFIICFNPMREIFFVLIERHFFLYTMIYKLYGPYNMALKLRDLYGDRWCRLVWKSWSLAFWVAAVVVLCGAACAPSLSIWRPSEWLQRLIWRNSNLNFGDICLHFKVAERDSLRIAFHPREHRRQHRTSSSTSTQCHW